MKLYSKYNLKYNKLPCGSAQIIPRFLNSLRTSTSGLSHWITTFLGSGMIQAGLAG